MRIIQPPSTDPRVPALSQQSEFPMTNLVKHGNFPNGTTEWAAYRATNSFSNNTLISTASGIHASPYANAVSKIDVIQGHKYAFKGRVKANSSDTASITVRMLAFDTFFYKTNPVMGEWNDITTFFTPASSYSAQIYIYHAYVDAATATGKSIEIQYFALIDLTVTFGAGNEPTTATELDALLAAQPNGWFNGTVNVISFKESHTKLTKELKTQKEEYTTGLNNQTKRYTISHPLFMPKKTRIVAHRGLGLVYPENTLVGFEECGKAGLWGIETDLRRTSDGRYVLMHDETVDRTTNGTGLVVDLTLAQIKEFTIDSGPNIANYPNLKVPTLEEYLLVCGKYGVVPVLNLYNEVTEYHEIVQIVNELGFEESAIYTVTPTAYLQTINDLCNSMVFQIAGAGIDLSIVAGGTLNNYGRSVSSEALDLYPDAIKSGHANKQVWMVWVVDDVQIAKGYIEKGMDVIMTDSLISL